MAEITSFKTEKELSDLITVIYPTSGPEDVWNKGVQLCIYLFGLAELKTSDKQEISLKQVVLSMQKAFNGDIITYLDKIYADDRLNEKDKVCYQRFVKTTRYIIKGLTIDGIVEIKKYLAS